MKTIYIKNYDNIVFGVQLDETANNENGYIQITEVVMNDNNETKATKERIALSSALDLLIAKHEKELIALYEKELKEIDD